MACTFFAILKNARLSTVLRRCVRLSFGSCGACSNYRNCARQRHICFELKSRCISRRVEHRDSRQTLGRTQQCLEDACVFRLVNAGRVAIIAVVHANDIFAVKLKVIFILRRVETHSTIGGGGRDVTNLSLFWEETARKKPLPGTYFTNPLTE